LEGWFVNLSLGLIFFFAEIQGKNQNNGKGGSELKKKDKVKSVQKPSRRRICDDFDGNGLNGSGVLPSFQVSFFNFPHQFFTV